MTDAKPQIQEGHIIQAGYIPKNSTPRHAMFELQIPKDQEAWKKPADKNYVWPFFRNSASKKRVEWNIWSVEGKYPTNVEFYVWWNFPSMRRRTLHFWRQTKTESMCHADHLGPESLLDMLCKKC